MSSYTKRGGKEQMRVLFPMLAVDCCRGRRRRRRRWWWWFYIGVSGWEKLSGAGERSWQRAGERSCQGAVEVSVSALNG
jgi:hypothetical protein